MKREYVYLKSDDPMVKMHDELQAARKVAKKAIDRAIQSFCAHMSKKSPQGFVAFAMTGLKLALMQSALEIQLLMEVHEQAKEMTRQEAEVAFVKCAQLAFGDYVTERDVYDESDKLIKPGDFEREKKS